VKRLTVLALLCLAVGLSAGVASAATPIVPSQAQAIHDTKIEIVHHYIGLDDPASRTATAKAQVECSPLTDTLWRCKWTGKSFFYTVFGSAKVRFYKYATDVSLYDLKCYNGPKASLDYCSRLG